MLTAKVRTLCPVCGDVELSGANVTILVDPVASRNKYAFECPICLAPIMRDASGNTVTVLLRAGAHVTRWPPDSGPITADELADFRDKLDRLPTANPYR